MIYFLIPVYNESANIQGLSRGLGNVLPGKEKHFIFVNDGSSDDTVAMIETHFAGLAYTILNNEANAGPGFSFNAGFVHVLGITREKTDLVVTIEGDNTSDLSILPLMTALSEDWGFDLVLASVYAQGGGFSKTSFLRKIISITANQVLRTAFNIKVLTLSSFYRVYKLDLVRRLQEKHNPIVAERGFLCALELLLKSVRLNASIIEVPMILRSEARKGKSKMKVMKTSLRYISFLFRQFFFVGK